MHNYLKYIRDDWIIYWIQYIKGLHVRIYRNQKRKNCLTNNFFHLSLNLCISICFVFRLKGTILKSVFVHVVRIIDPLRELWRVKVLWNSNDKFWVIFLCSIKMHVHILSMLNLYQKLKYYEQIKNIFKRK